MSFVLNIPSTFKTSTIPSIFGDNILTGNKTLNGDLKVNQSVTLGTGIMSDSSYESMEITQTLRVDEHSIFNSAIVEQSMNVVSSSQLNDVSAINMELTNLSVGLDLTMSIIQLQDISLSILEVTNIDNCRHLQVPDISVNNIEVEKLMLSDLSVNNATIANLSVNSVELETTNLHNLFSTLTNEVIQEFSEQSSVLYAFMAKGSSNYSISSGTTIPFVTNVSGCFETELSSFNNYSYTIDGSSSGIWHFGVNGHCINTSTTDLRLGIFRNDELIIQSQITQQNIHIHSTFECETNDVIQVKCTMGTGYIDLSNSCFFGYKYNPSNNNIEKNENILVNSLDMSHNENVTIETGNLILKQGDISMTSGHINAEGSIYTNGQVTITNQSTDYPKYFMKYNIDDSNYWNIYTNLDHDIYYNYGGTDKGFISSSSDDQMNFTGQHRCFIKDLPTISNKHIGLIVCANQNVYISMIEPRQSIHQNEALPYVTLCKKNNDKSCFGVISASEDPNKRVDEYGSFSSVFSKEKGDTRIYINSVGEGALWVINKNGSLESGDYITTTDISGYGMKQNSDNVKNYSVAKITMDCNFNPLLVPKKVILRDSNGENILNIHNQIQWTNDLDASGNIIYEYQYKIKYINQHANEISQQEYIDQSNNAYIASYVGCTYHSG